MTSYARKEVLSTVYFKLRVKKKKKNPLYLHLPDHHSRTLQSHYLPLNPLQQCNGTARNKQIISFLLIMRNVYSWINTWNISLTGFLSIWSFDLMERQLSSLAVLISVEYVKITDDDLYPLSCWSKLLYYNIKQSYKKKKYASLYDILYCIDFALKLIKEAYFCTALHIQHVSPQSA